jgi:hypothetical protein
MLFPALHTFVVKMDGDMSAAGVLGGEMRGVLHFSSVFLMMLSAVTK